MPSLVICEKPSVAQDVAKALLGGKAKRVGDHFEGPDAIATVRRMVGATKSNEAASGTIRGALARTVERNIIHASDGTETAAEEMKLWFGI
mgnify:CR=1 FL=1